MATSFDTSAQPEHPAITDLVREAFDEARELTKIEVALAKEEAKRELWSVVASATLFAVAGSFALVGITMLLVSIGLAIGSWIITLAIGIGCVVIAGALVPFGISRMPKKPMPETQRRLGVDVHDLKERIV
jgi:hypothetical protein